MIAELAEYANMPQQPSLNPTPYYGSRGFSLLGAHPAHAPGTILAGAIFAQNMKVKFEQPVLTDAFIMGECSLRGLVTIPYFQRFYISFVLFVFHQFLIVKVVVCLKIKYVHT